MKKHGNNDTAPINSGEVSNKIEAGGGFLSRIMGDIRNAIGGAIRGNVKEVGSTGDKQERKGGAKGIAEFYFNEIKENPTLMRLLLNRLENKETKKKKDFITSGNIAKDMRLAEEKFMEIEQVMLIPGVDGEKIKKALIRLLKKKLGIKIPFKLSINEIAKKLTSGAKDYFLHLEKEETDLRVYMLKDILNREFPGKEKLFNEKNTKKILKALTNKLKDNKKRKNKKRKKMIRTKKAA